MDSLVTLCLSPSLVSCQALFPVDAADCWLWGSHKVAGCRTIGAHGVSTGSLVGSVCIQKTQAIALATLVVEAESRVSARPLAGRALGPGV